MCKLKQYQLRNQTCTLKIHKYIDQNYPGKSWIENGMTIYYDTQLGFK